MRIALVTTSWPAGPGDPAGHFVRTEAAELERAGHDVVIVAPAGHDPSGAFGWPGVAARIRERPLRALEAARWVLQARTRVATLAVDRAIDRIVVHWAVPGAWPIAFSAPEVRVDVVSHGGDVRLLVQTPGLLRDRVAMAIAERASSWRFVSDALQRQLLEALGREARA